MSSEGFTSVQLRLREDELDALDTYRRDQKSAPLRPRAAEQLFRCGLIPITFGTGRPASRNTIMAPRLQGTPSSIASSPPAAACSGYRRNPAAQVNVVGESRWPMSRTALHGGL
jgi:hypothetical protein